MSINKYKKRIMNSLKFLGLCPPFVNEYIHNLPSDCKKHPHSVKFGLLCPSRQSIVLAYPLTRVDYSTEKVLFDIPGKDDLSDTVANINKDEDILLLSGSSHRIVDINTGKKLRDIYEHDGIIKAAAWSPKSPNVFATTGTDSTVRMWDIRQHPSQTMLVRLKRYSCVQFSPDGLFLCFGGDHNISLMDLRNPRNLITISSPSAVTGVKFNPVEYILATSHTDKVIRFWDIDSKECIAQTLPLDATPKGMQFSSCGRFLTSVSEIQINSFTFEPFDVLDVINIPSLQSVSFLDFKMVDDKLLYLSYDSKAQHVTLDSFLLSKPLKNGSTSPSISLMPMDSVVKGTVFEEELSAKNSTGGKHSRNGLSRSSSMSSTRNLQINGSQNNSPCSLIERKGSMDLSLIPDCSTTIKEHNAKIKKVTLDVKKRIESHHGIMEILKIRIQECRKIQSISGISNIDDTLHEAAKMPGAHTLVAIIKAYQTQCSTVKLSFYAKTLLYVKQLLSHNNCDYINLGLEILNGVLTEYGDVIKNIVNVSPSLGVEDEKNRNCITCKKALTEIYIVTPTLSGRLNSEQGQIYTTLLPMLKALVE